MFKELKTTTELNSILESTSSQIIFKHSTRCPISSSAYRNVEAFLEQSDSPIHLVYVVENRPMSNLIEEKTGVRHESPQVLVVRESKVLSHTSHHNITQDFLEKYKA